MQGSLKRLQKAMKGKLAQSQKKSAAKKRVGMSRTERQVRVREVSLMAIGY